MIRFISIHIPKTAGRSFREILRRIYGEKRVFDVTRESGKAWNEQLEAAIPPETEVLHGHFTFSDISKLYRQKNMPLVTWLRDPVERVISNYYFFIQRAQSGARPHVSHRRKETLMEYIHLETSRNRMSRFLEGIALEDLFFVGITEHFESELRDLSGRLRWGKVEPAHVNSNKEFQAKFPPVGEEIKKIIRDLNEKDVVLYEEGLRLRQLRCRSVHAVNV